jgi:hypothetical protein
MSLPEETVYEETKIKKLLVQPRRPVIIDSGYDFLLSQIDTKRADDDLAILFNEYFERDSHYIFAGLDKRDPKAVENVTKSINCVRRDHGDDDEKMSCALPCSCITLSGNRRIKVFCKDSPPDPIPPGSPWETTGVFDRIKTLHSADVIWLFFMDKMGLFEMLGALQRDFAEEGKFAMDSGEIYGLIMQELIKRTENGDSSRVKQRTIAYLRSIGMQRHRDEQINLPEGRIQVNSDFLRLNIVLLSSLCSLYREQRVTTTIVGVATQTLHPSSAAYAGITKTLQLLQLSMTPFNYGSNYSDVLKGIVWALVSLYVLRATRDKVVPGGFEKFEQLIPAAYSVLVKPSQTPESNRWVIYESIARIWRNFTFTASAVKTDSIQDVKDFTKIVEHDVEAIRDLVLKVTGKIDLADPKWQREDIELPQKW